VCAMGLRASGIVSAWLAWVSYTRAASARWSDAKFVQ
jgi:hypothetical protein